MKNIEFSDLAIALSYLDISYKKKLDIISLYIEGKLHNILKKSKIITYLNKINNIKENFDKNSIKYITIADKDYPEQLKQIKDPPFIIYYKGKKELLYRKNILAIVGTRKASTFYKNLSFNFAKDLSNIEITIVSGLALGIDTYAHKGALSGKGKTISVLANGLDIIYPYENKQLFYDIEREGLLLSEYPLGVKPLKWHFVARNRIISGLSKAVFVVQAPSKSGALITADYAIKQGRDVFVLPGRFSDSQLMGNNRLLKDGAKIILDINDILEEFDINITEHRNNYKKIKLTDMENKVFHLISKGYNSVNLLNVEFNNIDLLLSILTSLELKGVIKQEAGGQFSCLI